MQTFSSREVQNHWGKVTDIAKRVPVTVTQYGREAFMLVPVELGREAVRLHHANGFKEASGAVSAPQKAESGSSQESPVPNAAEISILDFLMAPLPGGRSSQEIGAALAADRDAWDK